jgi:hypothetical protein
VEAARNCVNSIFVFLVDEGLPTELGFLNLSQAFAPILARNGGGALLNVLSLLSWVI